MQTLLFIPGFRGNHLGLEDIAKHLSDYFDCICIDIPPFGNVSPLAEYTADAYANYIADYIKEHNLKKPVLVGHSMGSIIAAATAETHPELVSKKLILLAPISTKPPRWIANLTPLSTALPNKLVGYLTTKCMQINESRTQLKKTLKITYDCSKDYTSKADVKASAHFSSNHDIADFSFAQDTLFLAGEKDRLIKQKQTVALAKKLNKKAVFLENTGHLLNYEKPLETAAEIKKFLEN